MEVEIFLGDFNPLSPSWNPMFAHVNELCFIVVIGLLAYGQVNCECFKEKVDQNSNWVWAPNLGTVLDDIIKADFSFFPLFLVTITIAEIIFIQIVKL